MQWWRYFTVGLPIGQLDKTLLRCFCNAPPHGWSSQIFVGLLNFVSQRWQRGFIFHTKKIALSLMGVRNNYEFKVGNKKRSDNRTLENARHIFDDVRWMPGNTSDDAAAAALLQKNSNWGCNFTSKLLNFPLTNKVCQSRCMLICNFQKRCSLLLKETEIYHLRQVLRHFHEKNYHSVNYGDGLIFR